MIEKVAVYLKEEENVLGFDTLNEPSSGYVNIRDLNKRIFPAPLGNDLSGFEGMISGSGFTVKNKAFYSSLFHVDHFRDFNLNGEKIWLDGKKDVWENYVWKREEGNNVAVLLNASYFALNENEDFQTVFMNPFFKKMKERLAKIDKEYLLFLEPHIDLNDVHLHSYPFSLFNKEEEEKIVWAPHFYDGFLLLTKTFWNHVALSLHKNVLFHNVVHLE